MRFEPTAVQEVYDAKARQRQMLAALPIEAKIERLVNLQRRANEIAISAGRKGLMVWKLPSKNSTT